MLKQTYAPGLEVRKGVKGVPGPPKMKDLEDVRLDDGLLASDLSGLGVPSPAGGMGSGVTSPAGFNAFALLDGPWLTQFGVCN